MLFETNPLVRANYGREVGLNTEVPSLKRLCFSFFKERLSQEEIVSYAKEYRVEEDLVNEISRKRI